MSAFSQIEHQFVESVALIALHAGFRGREHPSSSIYQRGWWDGYVRAWIQITGKSEGALVEAVNRAIAGSGKELAL